MNSRWRLILASVLFVSWMAYLGYAAFTKSRAPIVSHIQAAVATAAVVAEMQDHGPSAKVVEKLWGEAAEGNLEVQNLPQARGYTGPGQYLLYLTQRGGAWRITGQQRSPGSDLTGVGDPLIYPWSEDVRKQAEKLRQ